MRISRSPLRIARVVAVVAVVTMGVPTAASAHSFLIRSEPPAGARLAASPKLLTMFFSEPFVSASEHVSVRRLDGAELQLQPAHARASEIRQPLPPRLRGIYVVSWRVLSDDGHISVGEYAFAVGSTAALPTLTSSTSGRTDLQDVLASWLFFVGLALALGGLVSERVLWRGAGVGRAPVLPALAAAASAQLWLLVLVAGARDGGGFTAGLSWRAVDAATSTRPGALTIVAFVAVAIAAAIAVMPRARVFAAVPLAGAAIATSARGHSGTSAAWWALPADSVHLLTAAVWVGALVHLVLVAARVRNQPEILVAGVRRYSRLALPTVLVVLASGVLTAIPEFRSFGDLVDTSYGRTLLVKSALIATALLFAVVSRRRGLADDVHPRFTLLRRATGAEALAVVAVLGAASVLVNAAPPQRQVSAAAFPALGPPPLQGPAVQLAELAGQLVVGLAATRQELRFTILPPGTQPAGSLTLTADARPPAGRPIDLFPRPCGKGCFTIRSRLRPGRTQITVHIASSLWRGGDATFEVGSPIPPLAAALLARVAHTMRVLPSLEVTEQVTSGPGSSTVPATYTLAGKQFMQTEVFGGGGVDVREISQQRGVRELSFAVPGSSIWYRMWIDGKNRLTRELILDPGHRIYRTFHYGVR